MNHGSTERATVRTAKEREREGNEDRADALGGEEGGLNNVF